jgi:hypothetical protein
LKRIAIFTEGQTELIFIRNFLLKVLDLSKISFECHELLAHKISPVSYQYPNPYADTHFLILDVHGDERVMSSIKEKEKDLIENKGYERIIGLRDMHSALYAKRAHGVINDRISNMIIQSHEYTVRAMTYSDRIKLYFAIMEIEAWFLGMCNLFRKIDPILTVEYIKQKLGIDLVACDPQKDFYKPSDQINSIFQLCGRGYKKKQDEIESICSKIDSSDFDAAKENGRCKCFNDFYKAITTCG